MNHEDDPIPADLAALLGDLPIEIEPENDLWEGIHDEIAPIPLRSTKRRGLPVAAFALAAAVLLAAVVSWSSAPVQPVVATTNTPVDVVLMAWELEVRRTTDELQAVLDARRETIDPETLRVVEDAIADIDSAIDDVQRALRADPNNDVLSATLAQVWQTKVHLLRNATEGEG